MFSDFIMRSLARTRGAVGVKAMKNFYRAVFRGMFMTLFLGTALVSRLVAGFSATGLAGRARPLISSAALIYLAGCFGVTGMLSTPLPFSTNAAKRVNDHLAHRRLSSLPSRFPSSQRTLAPLRSLGPRQTGVTVPKWRILKRLSSGQGFWGSRSRGNWRRPVTRSWCLSSMT